VVAVIVALALGGAGFAAALRTGEPFVYDSTIGETVPAALDRSMNAAIGNPNDPSGDGGTVLGAPPADNPPPADPGTIRPVGNDDGEYASPFSSDEATVINVFTENDDKTSREVYAGAVVDGSDSFREGVILDESMSIDDGSGSATTTTVPYTGPLTIRSYSNGVITLTGSRPGYTVRYSTSTASISGESCPKMARCGNYRSD
jgi:hypothetical protein